MTHNVVIPAAFSPRESGEGIQCRSFFAKDTGSRISLTLVRDDATVSDRCDAARLALGQLRHFAGV